jgi:MerR family transcriptional regulator/heat shock protein HspR
MTVEMHPEAACSLEVAAHLAGLSVRRVRYLIRAGLVQPARHEAGKPLFGETDLARLRRIRRMTSELGVNLAGIDIILRLTDELSVLRGRS